MSSLPAQRLKFHSTAAASNGVPSVKRHALAERERVRLAVLADLPRLGQARADLAAALVLDEPLEQQVLDVELARVVVRVEVAGAPVTPTRIVSRVGGGPGLRAAPGEGDRDEDEGEVKTHVTASPQPRAARIS